MQTLTALKDRTQWAIEYVIKQHDLKPAEIGRMIGSKPDTVRKYHARLSTPSVRFLQRFCTAFEIDFLWLYKGTGQPFPGGDVATFDSTAQATDAPSGKTPGAHAASAAPPDEATDGIWADGEMSFQKLALMAGIKIDTEWIPKLADTIGVASWKISLSIYHQRIARKLISDVESRGFKKEDWLVAIKSRKDATPAENDAMDISQLLKIAEEVLRSNTIHSGALAMTIISLKAVSNGRAAAPVLGANAISLPKTYDLRCVK